LWLKCSAKRVEEESCVQVICMYSLKRPELTERASHQEEIMKDDLQAPYVPPHALYQHNLRVLKISLAEVTICDPRQPQIGDR
jgi:hypothetical protein